MADYKRVKADEIDGVFDGVFEKLTPFLERLKSRDRDPMEEVLANCRDTQMLVVLKNVTTTLVSPDDQPTMPPISIQDQDRFRAIGCFEAVPGVWAFRVPSPSPDGKSTQENIFYVRAKSILRIITKSQIQHV